MGNQVQSETWASGNATPSMTRNVYEPGMGRITRMGRELSANPGETPLPDSTYRHYDPAGNVTWGEHKGWGTFVNNATGINHTTLTRNYYGADQKLRVVQVHDESTNGSTWTQDGSFAEYRYDPLGRRIMERTRRDSVCFNTSHDCESTLTRFVWAGDQLLWELRVPGGNNVPATSTGLESTYATGDFFGRVSYFHAGGIDKPLLITKEGVESVVPRETWRGQFHAGTSPATGAVRDCPVGVQTGCLQIAWPGMETNAAHSWGGEKPDIRVWYGGLVDGMRDASGQMYMRNRYYDPATGQFTQTDPIGLVGGLNAYGFAAGDPVSYNDPYGLCPEHKRDANGECPGLLADWEWRAVEATMPNMSPEARARTARLLDAGRIHGANLKPNLTGQVHPLAPRDISINRSAGGGSIFRNPHELGKTLVHEGEHVVQLADKAPGDEAAAYIAENKDELEAAAYRYEYRNYRPGGWDSAAQDATNVIRRP